jgi:hypothetical protein
MWFRRSSSPLPQLSTGPTQACDIRSRVLGIGDAALCAASPERLVEPGPSSQTIPATSSALVAYRREEWGVDQIRQRLAEI